MAVQREVEEVVGLLAHVVMIVLALSVPILLGWAAADWLTGDDSLVRAINHYVR